jgi:hypothetical protein
MGHEKIFGELAIAHYSEKVKRKIKKIRTRVLFPLYLIFVREMKEN